MDTEIKSTIDYSTYEPPRRPEYGEIWEDAEGCLYVNLGNPMIVRWAVFYNDELIPEHHPHITQPLRLAFDVKGNYVLGTKPLRYPGGQAWR